MRLFECFLFIIYNNKNNNIYISYLLWTYCILHNELQFIDDVQTETETEGRVRLREDSEAT